MQIALFGGRFDPIHNGHLAIAQEVLRSAPSVDEVWLVPDNHHHWNPTVASPKQRLEMLTLVQTDKIKANDIGIQVSHLRDGMTATIDVIRELQKKTKNTYIFIAGSDQLPRLSEWTDYKELTMRLPFLIVPRKGHTLKGNLPDNCFWLTDKEYEPLEDSATRVRERLANGQSISDLVPKSVEDYIKKHHLYGA
ncbi:MAG TPA: nicotinate (nicotinamide) nucleotide adenylyltransferase [Patescibacteria group bacterium]|nr:nicotinate (nicotinamide) nucleotide adenylyltransferase [Patescibacteria group bacterium]